MNDDPYRRVAGVYDRIFEPMNRGLRILGFRMFLPPPGGSILDIGCGTGTHLELYRKNRYQLHGIDSSNSMLEIARTRLGQQADLRRADASDLPYENNFFDLVLCMLVLHEMEDNVRQGVLEEMKRVLKPDGRLLFIDFHAGRPSPWRGWLFRIVILLSEIAAGRRHFRNYRQFMSLGGLPAIIEGNQLRVEGNRIVGGDNMDLFLLRPR